jgi:hypothetical protein
MEIEFRGQCKTSGKWVHGDLFQTINETTGKNEATFIIPFMERVPVEIIPDTVGMYIGQKDKNGAKIFSKDIVDDGSGNFGEVYWHKEHASFYWGRGNTLVHSDELMIIGNIHDNPELLSVS